MLLLRFFTHPGRESKEECQWQQVTEAWRQLRFHGH